MRGERRGCGVSTNEYSCAHGALINFGALFLYLTYADKASDGKGNFKELIETTDQIGMLTELLTKRLKAQLTIHLTA
jgi:hypothetical protein